MVKFLSTFAFFLSFVFLTFFFFAGCIIPKSESECDELKRETLLNNLAWGDVAMCYHEVAMGYALKGNSQSAVQMCDEISTGGKLSWIEASERNMCYFDIAEQLRDENICDKISASWFEHPTWFEDPTKHYKNQCKEKVEKAKNRGNVLLCPTIFIFVPMILFFLGREGLPTKFG
ncbi:MAG: hypothetical protein AB1391_02005 [Candidatus Micrarchaeota archaeon]